MTHVKPEPRAETREERITRLTREYHECQKDARHYANRWLSRIQDAEWRRSELAKLEIYV